MSIQLIALIIARRFEMKEKGLHERLRSSKLGRGRGSDIPFGGMINDTKLTR